VQIPLISGIYTDDTPNVRVSYPVNLAPVVEPNGVSNGYLRPADGIVEFIDGGGACRGTINWDGLIYAVFGSNLVSIQEDGTQTILGSVGDDGKPVAMDYSFDRLCVVSNLNAFLWDKTTFVQITDPDLGNVFDVKWVDGYFMFTDDEFLIVSELTDPTSIDPLKYGSAEIDPDPIQGIDKIRNEPYAVGRYTIEVFRNIGGNAFPFQRIAGGHIDKGAVGTHAFCVMKTSIAMVGSGRREENAVYLAVNGSTTKISTKEIDELLQQYTELELSQIVVEMRNERSSDLLYVHLPDRTLVFDSYASELMGRRVWYVLTSGINGFSQYRAKFFTYAFNKWYSGDPTGTKLGEMVDAVGSHYGDVNRWEFGTQMIYNESRGVVIPKLELVALTGSVSQGTEAKIATSYSMDGQTWSNDRSISAGTIGDRLKRIVWLRMGKMDSVRMQRFRGDSNSHISFLRLEAEIQPLFV
jgi:hypothetical protein